MKTGISPTASAASRFPFRPALLALAVSQALMAWNVQAATVTSSADDSSAGTLRYEIEHAASGDTIDFAAGLSGSTITLGGSPLDVDAKNLTIDGDLNDDGTPDITVSGSNGSSVFRILNGASAAIDGLTITDGYSSKGGGIIVTGSTLTLSNSTLSGNTASSSGGGLFSQDASVEITGSTISNNTSGNLGGGITNRYSELAIADSTLSGNNTGSYGGGILNLRSPMTISASTFAGNSAGSYGGGIVNYESAATISASTFSGNTAGLDGGGISNEGDESEGAEYEGAESPITIKASTLSDNTAGHDGGGVRFLHSRGSIVNSTLSGNNASGVGGGISAKKSAVTVVNSTLTGNAGGLGGGGIAEFESSADFHLSNTLIANSTGGDCAASLETNTHNLIEDNSCSPAFSGDPNLGALADNGGPTFTHALLPGSIAIDHGDDAIAIGAGLFTDQRGTGYARIVGPKVDIGAFEYGTGGTGGRPLFDAGTVPLDTGADAFRQMLCDRFLAGGFTRLYELTGCSASQD